jgi:aminoglycoside 6-adenylyltransferase
MAEPKYRNQAVPSVTTLYELILAWAEQDENVRALVLTGSTARDDGRKDEFSDLDVEVIARDGQPLLESDAWFEAFGEIWAMLRFDERQYPTRLLIYEGGSKVDFTVGDRGRLDEQRETLDDLYERGYRVLLDKDGIAEGLPAPTGLFEVAAPPTQAEFRFVVEEFWFEAMHMPKYLVRGDLWVVKFRDWTMKCDLLRMLEWRAVALASEPVDVHHIGHQLREWVDEATWQEVQGVFGQFGRDDAQRAVLATCELFGRVARETADVLGLEYPDAMEREIRGYIARFV